MNDDKTIEFNIEHISKMLEEALSLYKEDRSIAKKNYEMFQEQLQDIYDSGLPMSEEGALEREANLALKTYIDSGKRLEKVLDTVAKIFNNQMNNRTKLLVADKFTDDSKKKLTAPIDFKSLTQD
jgi:hypothetical protein